MPTILSVGQDTDLLNTRSGVLRLCTAEVVSASTFSALETLKDQSIDLLVLCHTLSWDERNELAVIAHQRCVRVLEVLTLTERDQRSAVDDRVASNPNALIAKVAKILNEVVGVSCVQ